MPFHPLLLCHIHPFISPHTLSHIFQNKPDLVLVMVDHYLLGYGYGLFKEIQMKEFLLPKKWKKISSPEWKWKKKMPWNRTQHVMKNKMMTMSMEKKIWMISCQWKNKNNNFNVIIGGKKRKLMAKKYSCSPLTNNCPVLTSILCLRTQVVGYWMNSHRLRWVSLFNPLSKPT